MKNKKITQNSGFRFLIVIAIPLAFFIICQFSMSAYWQKMITLFLINVLLCASLNLTNGFTGIFSMGHSGFMAIGAYFTTLLIMSSADKTARIEGIPGWLANVHAPFWVALLIAGVVALGVAALVGSLVLKAKGDYLSVMTLGLIFIIKGIVENNDSITNGSRGLSGIPNKLNLLGVLVVLILSLFILYKVVHSSFGRSMLAIRDDEAAASSLGIHAAAIKILSFSIGAFFGAVGGGLWAMLQGTISPSYFYLNETFQIVEMSVLGGMYTLSGSFYGAAILTFLPQLLSNLESGFSIGPVEVPALYGLSNIIMSIIFILVIMFRPRGVSGTSEFITDTMFSAKTYRDLFHRETWQEFADIVKTVFTKNKSKAEVLHTTEKKEEKL